MRDENVWVATSVAAVAAVAAAAVAVFGGVTGWLPRGMAAAAALGAAALAVGLLALGARARRRRDAVEPPERLWRRADGPWPAYDRRRSAAGEPAQPPASRDRQTSSAPPPSS